MALVLIIVLAIGVCALLASNSKLRVAVEDRLTALENKIKG